MILYRLPQIFLRIRMIRISQALKYIRDCCTSLTTEPTGYGVNRSADSGDGEWELVSSFIPAAVSNPGLQSTWDGAETVCTKVKLNPFWIVVAWRWTWYFSHLSALCNTVVWALWEIHSILSKSCFYLVASWVMLYCMFIITIKKRCCLLKSLQVCVLLWGFPFFFL